MSATRPELARLSAVARPGDTPSRRLLEAGGWQEADRNEDPVGTQVRYLLTAPAR